MTSIILCVEYYANYVRAINPKIKSQLNSAQYRGTARLHCETYAIPCPRTDRPREDRRISVVYRVARLSTEADSRSDRSLNLPLNRRVKPVL